MIATQRYGRNQICGSLSKAYFFQALVIVLTLKRFCVCICFFLIFLHLIYFTVRLFLFIVLLLQIYLKCNLLIIRLLPKSSFPACQSTWSVFFLKTTYLLLLREIIGVGNENRTKLKCVVWAHQTVHNSYLWA